MEFLMKMVDNNESVYVAFAHFDARSRQATKGEGDRAPSSSVCRRGFYPVQLSQPRPCRDAIA
uniref:Uncharacterized protein n=1 Tax=Setaria italica TaxID=4555 RepID=K3Y3V1_SETIT